jgi:hypothetical protein
VGHWRFDVRARSFLASLRMIVAFGSSIIAVASLAGCSCDAPDAWEPKENVPPPVLRQRVPPVIEAPPGTANVDQFLARKERWPVKVGADPRAKTIRIDDDALDKANVKSVAELVKIRRPNGLPDKPRGQNGRWVRFGNEETTIYRVDCVLVEAKFEDEDKDYHVVIRDPFGDPSKTMIIEFPRPDVVPVDSPFRDRILEARADLDKHVRVRNRFRPIARRARVWGVGFFDFVHGQRGVAPNGIELHPVLKIEFK